MLSEPCILLYGNDDYLLETRQLVLERVGFIRTVSSFLALHEIISTRNIDILILCHSLSREECEHALAVAHVHALEIKTVVLISCDATCARGAGPDCVLSTWDGPKKLVETVRELTGSQKTA